MSVAAIALLVGRLEAVVRPMVGYPMIQTIVPNLDTLLGTRIALGLVGQMIFSAAFNAVWIVFALVAVNLVARRVWITGIVMALFLMLTGLGNTSDTPPVWLGLLVAAFTVSVVVLMMLRFGLLLD